LSVIGQDDVEELKKQFAGLEIKVQQSFKEAMVDMKKDLAEFVLQDRSK
jgi:hypothetical protein